jgi:hypothetical protein
LEEDTFEGIDSDSKDKLSSSSLSEPDGSESDETALLNNKMTYNDNKSMLLNISPELKQKYHKMLTHPDFPRWFENWINQLGILMPKNVEESLYFHLVSHNWGEDNGQDNEINIHRLETELFHQQRAEAQELQRRYRRKLNF